MEKSCCMGAAALFVYIFCTDQLGDTNGRRRVRPDGAAAFSAPAERGTRTALACSPLTGGKFFAEVQRGDSPSADGGSVAAPAAGAKRKGHLRFPFLFELLPFPCLIARRKSESGDRFEKGNDRGFFLCCGRTTFGVRPLEQPIRRVRDRTATQVGYFQQARHDSAAQLVSLEITEGTYDLGIWYSLSSQALSIIMCEQVAQHCYVAPAETLRPV